MNLKVLKFEMLDSVAIVKMNHPPVNAMTQTFLADLNQVLNHVREKVRPRAMLLTSESPGFFSSGDDINTLQNIDSSLIQLLPKVHSAMDTFEQLPFPTIAAINGHALGGGCELAMVCDFRFMGDDSGRIGLPEVRLGMIPVFGGTQRLPQLVGKSKAIEMMIKGLQLEAKDALQIGLIHDIFPQSEIYERSLDYAKRLARQATGAIARIKACVYEGYHGGIEKGLTKEIEVFGENINSHDAKEGVSAFLEGRKPNFVG
jgi:enoyl-CoA hydratase/carnithine racemase